MRRRTNKTIQAALLAVVFIAAAASAAALPVHSGQKSAPGNSHKNSSKKKSSKKRVKTVRGQKAPTADRITEIQQALAKDGSYSGTPTGKWDAATTEAMKNFQAGHGMSPTGKFDAKSLQKLGLGSQIAGVAAPAPKGPMASANPSGSTQRQ
jgi:peptidoglycan hydrolase-like protein with peptidoglycan-binding domain